MEHLFYRKQYEDGKFDPDVLIRCLLSALKSAEETNQRLRNRVQTAERNEVWITTGQPSQHLGDWQ